MRAIGLMSGTSLDGVDAAWLETDGTRIARFGPCLTLDYPAALQHDLRRLLDLAPDWPLDLPIDDPFLRNVTHRLTQRHIEAVAALSQRMAMRADLIGFHGQTILHRPAERRSWQIGDAAMLAQATGVRVVYDFRSADVAAGGQGAPLVPVYHAALAEMLEKPVAVLNIGGVANLTWIGADGALLAFDTGPGNGPLNDWVRRHAGAAMDRNGALAAAGCVDRVLLDRILQHPFLSRPGPKSLDRLDFAEALTTLESLSVVDGAATLVTLIARAVALAPLPAPPRQWLVCGGGRHNPAIMAALRQELAAPVEPVEAVGWDGDGLEAQCFAFLAVRSLKMLPLSFPDTTGVPLPCAGGKTVFPEGTQT